MLSRPRIIFLADDDEDDRLLFQEALNEISVLTQLVTVRDGEQLMDFLSSTLPDVLFLDLNMPRKDGFQCLVEIKKDDELKGLPVIIFSTSFQPDVVDKLYEHGAHYYIRKPSNFEHFIKVIHHVLLLITKEATGNSLGSQPPKEKFILEAELIN
jgi:CheY-like chemotaxis protein